MNWKQWIVTSILLLLICPIIFFLSFETDGHADCDNEGCKLTCDGDILTEYDLQYMTQKEIAESIHCDEWSLGDIK